MEEILKLLGKMNSQEVASKIGKNAGLDSQQTMEVIKKALPALMGAIGENANDAEKAPALDQALSYHENDNVSDLNQFLGNLDTSDAQKMLNHILSGKKDVLQQQVAKNANAKPNQVNDVMKMLAPILMGALGNQKKSGNININDLGKILGTQSGSKPGQSSGLMDMATKMFDKDGDGSMMDEAADFLGKLLKNK